MKLRLNQQTRSGRALLWLASRLIRLILGLLGRSWRIRFVSGRDVHDRLLAQPRPILLAFWHNRSVIAASFLIRHFHRRRLEVALLASQSRDGELVVGLAKAWGLRVVRGSATRGGRQAMWGMYKAIKAGASPTVIPDGPVGPIYEVKSGILFLAQTAEVPILPFGFAADRSWRLKSWDRLIIPKPFARVAVVLGEPRSVDPGLDEPGREALALETKQWLDELTRKAEEAVGGSFPN